MKKLILLCCIMVVLFTGIVRVTSARDRKLKLDDNAGGSSFIVQDSDTINQFSVNSDGKGYFAENLKIGTTGDPHGILGVNGQVSVFPGDYSWGSVVALDAGNVTNGRVWWLLSLGGDATEGVGKFSIKDWNVNANRLTIDTNGYVGIGTNNPSYPLQMASGACVTTGGVWRDASSRRYKENIRDLATEEAMMTLEELRPMRFNYKVEKDDECLGFIAEDVPELVASKDRKSLSPMDIVTVLTKVVQSQQAEIEVMKRKIKALEQ